MTQNESSVWKISRSSSFLSNTPIVTSTQDFPIGNRDRSTGPFDSCRKAVDAALNHICQRLSELNSFVVRIVLYGGFY